MTISPETLKNHFAYTAWATERLLDSASNLTGEELMRDFQSADRSVIGTLVHIFEGDRAWLARLEGEPPAAPVTEEDRNLATLKEKWPALHGRWAEWIAGLDEPAPEREITYADKKGKTWRTEVWRVIFHVVNHGTHHRGQVTGFIRALGHTPPSLDLMAYYRSQARA